MNKSYVAIASVILAICTVGCNEDLLNYVNRQNVGDGDPTSPDPTQSWCASNNYVAAINGMSATAQLSYEVGLTVIYVNGEVSSQTARYSFSGCELYRDDYTGMPTNNVCWVEVSDHNSYERFRAELQFYEAGSEKGFYLTANAYEGASSTSYNFVCR